MESQEEKLNLNNMSTETRNALTQNLDTMSSLEIVTIMNKEDQKVALSITPHLPEIAKAVDFASSSLEKGGRIFYMGAGTSGRLGVCDAAECPPTFSASPEQFIGLIAGGPSAFLKAVEGAEDSFDLGKEDLIKHKVNNKDTIIGLAASGRTPYVIGGLKYGKEIGCKTVSISCNLNSEIGKIADVKIEVIVGPEVLTGSTRLKAGTAQKMILNMISTGAMVKYGKVYGNLMVDLMQNNKKLKVRAENIVMEVTGVERDQARKFIDMAKGSVKVAIVMILANVSYDEALKRLEDGKGFVRKALTDKI